MDKDDLNKWGFRKLAEIGRMLSFDHTADNLDHYLDSTGETKALTRDEARDKLHIRNAEEINRKRFIQGFLDQAFDKSGNAKPGRRIATLKDGQKTSPPINDYWDYLIGTGNPDEYLATGKTTLNSKGNFNAKRLKNTIYIDGTVNHYWWDQYDFDKKKIPSAYGLVESGKAKNFREEAAWKQRLTGTIELQDKKLVRPQFTWQDID